jgi:hypothetical protein
MKRLAPTVNKTRVLSSLFAEQKNTIFTVKILTIHLPNPNLFQDIEDITVAYDKRSLHA